MHRGVKNIGFNGRSIQLILVGVTAVLLLFWVRQQQMIGWQLGVPLDDAWIHYRFAQNLSQGYGFSYNPGEPTPGSTAPLWTMLLALIGLFTSQLMGPSLILSALFLLGTVWLSYRLALLLGFPVWVGWATAVATGLSGRMLWAGLSGMEVTLFCGLSLLTVWLYEREGLSWKTAVIVALASQVRPEAHLLFLILIADTLYKNRTLLLSSLFSLLLVPILIYTLINLPYTLFSLSVTGQPLPNTFYAKSDSTQFYSLRTLRELIAIHFQDNGVLFVLIPLGLKPVWRRSRVTAVWLVGLFLVTPMVVPFLWHHGRYTMPLIPFMMLTGAIGGYWLWQKIGREMSRGWVTAVLLLVLLAAGVRLPFWAEMLANNSREIIETDVAVGRWLAQNTPPDALIAVDDIGAIGMLSERQLFDLNGLVSPQVWPVMNDTAVGIPRDAAMTRVLAEVRPDYLVIFPEWHWNIAINPQLVREVTQFTTPTRTIIGEQRVIVYEVVGWPLVGTAVPSTTTNVIYGDAIALSGYDLELEDQIDITLYWQSVAPLSESYDVFIHLYDEQNNIVTQADSVPVGGLLPTQLWQPGDTIADHYTLPLPEQMADGVYWLGIGLFHRPTGVRLMAKGEEEIIADTAVLTTLIFPDAFGP